MEVQHASPRLFSVAYQRFEKGIQEGNTALASLREETAKKLDSAESQRAKSKQREHELESELALTQAELETSHQNISSLKSEQASNDAALRASKQREATSLSYTQTLTHQLNQTTTHLEEHQEVLESLNASASYRLGYALLQPFRLCRAIAYAIPCTLVIGEAVLAAQLIRR